MSVTTGGPPRSPTSARQRLSRWANRLGRALARRTMLRVSHAARFKSGDDLHAALTDPRLYRLQIDRLHERHLLGRGIHELRQGGVSLATVAARRDDVARVVARTVAAGAYRLQPAELRTIRVGGKKRVVYAFPLADVVVHGAVSDLLESAIADGLSPHLYSYREGVPWWRADQNLAAFVRRHRRVPGSREGGLYILRRDVNSYADSIPVDPESPLWPMIRQAVGPARSSAPIGPADWDLIDQVVRPEIDVEGSTPVRRTRGVPTGQPISCVLFNLYLGDLDREMAAIPGAFYARYSDDIVFAHPDASVARRASALLVERLAGLGLIRKEAKSRDLFVTGAGRPSEEWPEAKGANGVTFLGLRVNADGTVGLDPAKARELVRDMRRRAQAAAAAADNPDEAARLACLLIRRAIDPDDPDASTKTARLVRRVVTDRRQLAELDHRIARELAGVLTNDRSIRAFRLLPPHVLREQWGLPSLVEVRNRVGRARSRPRPQKQFSVLGPGFRRRRPSSATMTPRPNPETIELSANAPVSPVPPGAAASGRRSSSSGAEA